MANICQNGKKIFADKGSDTECKYVLAVTCPGQRLIMLIDIETVPATKLKVIKTDSNITALIIGIKLSLLSVKKNLIRISLTFLYM